MTELLGKKVFLSGSFLFAVVLFIILQRSEALFLSYSGVLIFLSAALVLSLLNIAPVMFLLIAALPFSCKMMLPFDDMQIIFPSEPLSGLLLLVYFLRFFTGRQKIDYAFMLHPVTIIILLYLMFSMISLLFSTMLLVSVKAMMVKTVYIMVYYFLFYELIREAPFRGLSYFVCYGISLCIIILYTLYNHSGYQFSKVTSGIVALPFYADHTIYSACIVFVLPVLILFSFNRSILKTGLFKRFIFALITSIFLTGIYFSYCRAAWVSLVFGLLLLFFIIIKIKPSIILAGLILISGLAFFNSEVLMDSFKQNRYDSNARDAGFEEQTKSITNISNDQSNGERLNRWKCALRMFEVKPWFGFGPGTYQFQYLPFQKQDEMTRISVTNPYNIQKGHGGTAHSEYFLALSEGGIFVSLCFFLLCCFTFFIGMRNCYVSDSPVLKVSSVVILFGVVTYFVHGFFNNFLDTDKLAFLFWSAIAMITAIDLQNKKQKLINNI